MNIIELLKERVQIFAVDDVEVKRTQELVNAVNQNFLDMANTIQQFKEYKISQLKGELHTKIVMVKSLAEEFVNWQAVQDVYHAEETNQRMKMMEFNAQKAKLINSLKSLLNESKKSPVVSLYDLFGQDYQLCPQGHEVIILGDHNSQIIQYAIDVFEECLVVKGNFEMISGITLQANYSTVMQNAELCNNKLDDGTIKLAKIHRLRQTVEQMVDVGKQVVMFETYKNALTSIGVKPKDIQSKEKAYAKLYVPIKKLLQKELGVQLADICAVVVDEGAFATSKLI